MRDLPQQQHCDLGLVDDDHTPDMRTPSAATEGSQSEHPTSSRYVERKF